MTGLAAAIRLKTTLLHKLATRPCVEWPDDVDRFIAAVESCDLQDTTALVVLLADLKETIHAFTGLQAAGEPVTERGPPPLVSEASSREEILGQFRLEVAGWLCAAVGHQVIVSPIVARLTHFIDENYAERLTLDVLAAVVGRSKRHVATLFRQQTGQTVHRYLTQVRVHHAAALIRQREKIEAVSLLVGYRGKKNFYQHFKQQLGVTPGAYKAALMGLAPPSGGEAAERVDP